VEAVDADEGVFIARSAGEEEAERATTMKRGKEKFCCITKARLMVCP
jgi:hypothetical protein